MGKILKGALIVLSIAYPFLVYWGLQHYDAAVILLLLLLLVGLRWFAEPDASRRRMVIGLLVGMIAVVLLLGQRMGLKFYPVLVNLSFLLLFAGSLLYPPTIVERLARLRHPNLPEAAVAYTRKVTLAWSLFFVFNGSVAAGTALWASEEVWVLYNGFISYLLIAALAGGEWLVRRKVQAG